MSGVRTLALAIRRLMSGKTGGATTGVAAMLDAMPLCTLPRDRQPAQGPIDVLPHALAVVFEPPDRRLDEREVEVAGRRLPVERLELVAEEFRHVLHEHHAREVVQLARAAHDVRVALRLLRRCRRRLRVALHDARATGAEQ